MACQRPVQQNAGQNLRPSCQDIEKFWNAAVAVSFFVTASRLHRWVQLQGCDAAVGDQFNSNRNAKMTADQQADLRPWPSC